MNITAFGQEHIAEAEELSAMAYSEEQKSVKSLPTVTAGLDLSSFADNGYSVAAVENNRLIGFLCSVPPFEHVFGSTDANGVFSPMGANAAIIDNREKIYAMMYQTAAEKWVKAGALSHALCLYAHDVKLQYEFFRLGFGMRCVDAIRYTEEFVCAGVSGYEFAELPVTEYAEVYPLYIRLGRHYQTSPFFLNRACASADEFGAFSQNKDGRFFAAYYNGEICAYYEVAREGETYICDNKDYLHIFGAYCNPEHRGKGVAQNLLNFVIRSLKADGYTTLGVDFESINPTAYGFWTKYFTPYTHSVVRRIDDHILHTPKI